MFTDKIDLKDFEKQDPEYQDLLRRVLAIQADCEIGGPNLYVKHILPSAPTKLDQLIVARTAAEEMDHYRKMARLAGDIGVDVSYVLSRSNQERYVEAFRGEIQAWEEGSVGWAGVKELISWEGEALESRATYILHLERGEWKVVHVHWSFPRSNLETLGRSLTLSLDELERTIQRERPDLSASLAVDGTVTIMFTDIVDSTPMLARLGDRAWLEIIRRHNRLIEAATAAHGIHRANAGGTTPSNRT